MNQSDFPVIILAGGLGTRLRGVVNDLPKPMAMINGKPFLHYLFLYLTQQKIKKAILSVGYKASVIEAYFGDKYLDVQIQYCREQEPLGTGGGIKKAFEFVDDYSYVLNGDTFFDINLQTLSEFHFKTHADISLALRHMKNFDRYGIVQMNNERIAGFEEKASRAEGLINGGVYFFSKTMFSKVEATKFSFEKDILEKQVADKKMNGCVFDGYFIDIGIPEDYEKSQRDFHTIFC